jgi:aryl-alcohol dehydrogenase-like predicted oxidoreductase
MRYRPFTKSGSAASAITLVLDDPSVRPADWLKIVYAGLEAGVNSFELAGSGPGPAEALREALVQVDRRMLLVTLRVGRAYDGRGEPVADFRAEALTRTIDEVAQRIGLERFDTVVLDNPRAGEVSHAAMGHLSDLRERGSVRMLGIAGSCEVTDGYVSSGAFDVLATRFNIRSGWPERNRIKNATVLGMTVVGCDYMVREEKSGGEPRAARKGLAGLFAKKPEPVASGPYEFLADMPGWTPEALCLAYALTEPSLATVRVRAASAEDVESLAAAVDRELPTGLAAQIEMARFAQVA